MNKLYLIAALFLGLVIVISGIMMAVNNQNKNCDLINNQKAKDDCYHALAHETTNKAICDKISDTEETNHCFAHVPD